MLIIWGTKVKRQPRGTVADQCAACAEVRPFTVIDHFEFNHIYYLSVGQGTLVAITRQCQRCGNEFECVPNRYNEFLSKEAAEQMALDEIIERTNTRLAEIRASRKQIENMTRERPISSPGDAETQVMLPETSLRVVPPSAEDAELRETLGRLEAYEGRRPEVNEFLQRLQGWRSLDSSGKSALLDEIKTFIDNQQRRERAVAFLDEMLRSFPQHLGWFPALVVFAAFGAGFWWAYNVFYPCALLSYGLIGFAAVAACYIYATKMIHRRWMRNTIIPQAQKAGVDFKVLASLMAEIAQMGERVDERLREMAAESWLLEQEAAALHGNDPKA